MRLCLYACVTMYQQHSNASKASQHTTLHMTQIILPFHTHVRQGFFTKCLFTNSPLVHAPQAKCLSVRTLI